MDLSWSEDLCGQNAQFICTCSSLTVQPSHILHKAGNSLFLVCSDPYYIAKWNCKIQYDDTSDDTMYVETGIFI